MKVLYFRILEYDWCNILYLQRVNDMRSWYCVNLLLKDGVLVDAGLPRTSQSFYAFLAGVKDDRGVDELAISHLRLLVILSIIARSPASGLRY